MLGVLGLTVSALTTINAAPAQAATTGYQNLSNGGTIGSTNEDCHSFLVGNATPKVTKTLLSGSQTYLGGVLSYEIGFNPPPTATYNARDCLIIEDPAGNYLSTLDEAQFNNISPGPTLTYQYILPTTEPANFAPPNQLCNVAKTQELVNGGVADRKSPIACFAIPAPADLAISKTANGNFVTGSTGSYTLGVANTGGSPTVSPATITDTLPAGETFVAATGSGWTCGFATGTVTCNRATSIAAGTSAPPVTLTVQVTAAGGTTITNTASVAPNDATPTDNTSSATISVAAPPDLAIATSP